MPCGRWLSNVRLKMTSETGIRIKLLRQLNVRNREKTTLNMLNLHMKCFFSVKISLPSRQTTTCGTPVLLNYHSTKTKAHCHSYKRVRHEIPNNRLNSAH